MSKNTNGGSASKLALSSDEQNEIRRATKAKRNHGNGSKGTQAAQKQLSIPEEGNRVHLLKIIDTVAALQLNQKRSEFVSAFVVAYSQLTRDDVLRAGKSRVALTFEKVEQLLGAELVKSFNKDWSQAKNVFFKAVHDNSLKSCTDQVAEERRQIRERFAAKDSQVTTTIADFVGETGLADLAKQLATA